MSNAGCRTGNEEGLDALRVRRRRRHRSTCPRAASVTCTRVPADVPGFKVTRTRSVQGGKDKADVDAAIKNEVFYWDRVRAQCVFGGATGGGRFGAPGVWLQRAAMNGRQGMTQRESTHEPVRRLLPRHGQPRWAFGTGPTRT